MCECYQIDGPFIGADPNCPAHGDGGMHETIQKQAARIERLEAALREIKGRLFTQSCTCSFAVDEIIARAALEGE